MKSWRKFLLFFFGALGFGLFSIIIFVHSIELDCLKQYDGSYTCEKRTLFFDKVQIFQENIENIVGIVVMDDGCSEGCSYRAEFVTSAGKQVPLTFIYMDRGPVTRHADAIRRQIDRGIDHFNYKINTPWWVLYLIGGLTILSMLVMFFAFRNKKDSLSESPNLPSVH